MKKISDERIQNVYESIKKLSGYYEIENLMGRTIAACNFKQEHKVFSQFSEREDIYFEFADEGLFEGREAVRALLHMIIGGEPIPGDMLDIQLTSPMVVVADDLHTARGVWWTVGAASVPREGRNPQPLWCWGAFAADFIFENGEWKIWHLHYFRWIKCDYHKGWVDDTSLENRPNTALHPLAKASRYHNPFTPYCIRDGIPPCPRPYSTYDGDSWMLERDKTK